MARCVGCAGSCTCSIIEGSGIFVTGSGSDGDSFIISSDGHEILFSYAGTLTASDSPPVRVRRSETLDILAVTLGTAGSTSTVIAVKKNGATIATVTVPPSTVSYDGIVNLDFTAEDVLLLTITTPGTGAANMTAEARLI